MGINGGRYIDFICQGEPIGGEAPHLQQDASHDEDFMSNTLTPSFDPTFDFDSRQSSERETRNEKIQFSYQYYKIGEVL